MAAKLRFDVACLGRAPLGLVDKLLVVMFEAQEK
jgi:hypothetical protein